MRDRPGRVQEHTLGEFYTGRPHPGSATDREAPAAAPTWTEPCTGRSYDASAYLVRIGRRGRRPDAVEVGFTARVRNPVAVGLGPGSTADEVLALVERLNPHGEPGRLAFLARLGSARVRDVLPDLVGKAAASGVPVVWVCDPRPLAHHPDPFDEVVAEVRAFFEVHRELGTHPGGLHLELTGEDPRHDRNRLLDLAFLVAELHGYR
ncbi:3-deoxy-7-phosphoheptulonate synthase [Kitasatospora sp. NPDC001309]|uniref:3-deoxy-7-phosphoheptulonate synthase n=1 Tax=Kitasatospora sp. NPDC001309 TaxID=3364013 RepID=UPI0036CDCC22